MSLTVCSEWSVDADKNVTYFDQMRNQKFATGVTKKVTVEDSTKPVNMYEHKFNFGTSKPYMSTQFNGYQIDYRPKTTKAGHMAENHLFVLPIFRRQRGTSENKKEIVFAQTQDDVEVFLGLQEPKPVEAPVTEQATESTEPVAETTEPVAEAA